MGKGKQKGQRQKKALRWRLSVLAALILVLFSLALAAEHLTPHDPNQTDAQVINQNPSIQYPAGTDRYGRCVFSRVLLGSRTSLLMSLTVVCCSCLSGTLLGMLAAYRGGWADMLLMRLADTLLAFPQMVLAIAVAGILGGGMINAMLAVGLTAWTLYARLARSRVLAMKKEAYIQAAKLSGAGTWDMLFHQFLPNLLGPMLVTAATQLASCLIDISGLSFLGIGVTEPHAEWGSMISSSRAYIQLAPWTVLAPALAVIVTVMLFNEFGDAVRELLAEGGRVDG